MFNIEFQLDGLDESVHEFDLGHISVETDGGVISSRNQQPDQSMMVFIAATDLLDGIVELLTGKRREFEFVGCDSSFILNFSRNKNTKIDINYKKKKLCSVSDSEVFEAAYRASRELLEKYGPNLVGSGAAKGGLEMALDDARRELGCFLKGRN